MNLDDMTELSFTRLTWREQLAVVHITVWHALRRLFRRESRYFLVLDGKPVAKFIDANHHTELLEWLTKSHERATDYGAAIGRERAVAKYIAENGGIWEGFYGPDAEPAGTG